MDNKYSPLKVYVLDNDEIVPADQYVEDEDREFTGRVCDLLCMSSDHSLTSAIHTALGGVFPISAQNEKRINLILAVLESFTPRHFGEVMLIIQMCLGYELSIRLYNAALSRTLIEDIERGVNMALKLSRSCNTTAENLVKMRRNGEQKVIVEHKGGGDVE